MREGRSKEERGEKVNKKGAHYLTQMVGLSINNTMHGSHKGLWMYMYALETTLPHQWNVPSSTTSLMTHPVTNYQGMIQTPFKEIVLHIFSFYN